MLTFLYLSVTTENVSFTSKALLGDNGSTLYSVIIPNLTNLFSTVLFYAKMFLSAEERVTVSFYSSYQHDHDINYSTAQDIQPSTARER